MNARSQPPGRQVAPVTIPAAHPTTTPRWSPGGFFEGMGLLGKGFGMYRKHPGLMLAGLIPALVASAVLVVAWIALVIYVDVIVDFLTPFMEDWPSLFRDGSRLLVAVVVVLLSAVVAIRAFSSLAQIIGQPIYEAISKRVEDDLGGVPGEINVSFWRSIPREIGDFIRLSLRSVVRTVLVFLVGLIPVAGTAVAIILGILVGGWTSALDITSGPFDRRGLYYRDRRKALRRAPMLTSGFGTAVYLAFWFPPLAVLFMPAAVAGATLLSRRVLGLPTEPPSAIVYHG